MPLTYEPIATQTLGSAASSVTFSSIPSTYTDLILVCSIKIAASATAYTLLNFNSDTGTNYSSTMLYGNGSAAGSNQETSTVYMYLAETAFQDSTFSTVIAQIMNYSNATTNKTVLSRANNSSRGTEASVGLWRSTAAINTILVRTNANNFDTGSTFTLYGIKAA
jgi:hypothetical protein